MKTSYYRLFSSLEESPLPPKRAEIDTATLRHNFRTLTARLHASAPQLRSIAVVKADAYGHGAPFCVAELLKEGCDFFAVSCIEEAIAVRRVCCAKQSKADILILGYTNPAHAALLVEFDLLQALISADYAPALSDSAQAHGVRPRVHVALDTGMGRIGFGARTPEEIQSTVQEIASFANGGAIDICGMFTHFSHADCKGDAARKKTDLQLSRYRTVQAKLEELGVSIPFHHTCNSAAALTRSDGLFDGVRLGIVLYGAAHDLHKGYDLRPVMRLVTEIVHIQTLPHGESVGYGGRFTADGERRIAVLPIGYADGLPRSLRGASVTLETKSGVCTAPIVGNVCMDQCMIDITDTDAELGTQVPFFGDSPEQLTHLSKHAKTIDYELLCAVSARVPRVYRTKPL